MKIIGAGFSRTGTFSLKQALQILGFDPCYHGEEIFQRPDDVVVWTNALTQTPDWRSLFAGYLAGLDSPICFFWRDIYSAFPDAKVILTKRDPDDWYESFKDSLYRAMLQPERAPEQVQGALLMAKAIVLEHFFDNRFEDKPYALEVYQRHNESIEASFVDNPDRLLVFEVTEGWASLCHFLGKDLPDVDFPRTNSRAEFQALLS